MTEETQIAKLAEDVLDIARNRLLVNFRYLDTALTFPDRAFYDGTIASDGKVIRYDPLCILRIYTASKEQMTRTYLHTVLHCVFHHPFTGKSVDRPLWDLACDIAVETVVNELGLTCTFTDKKPRQEYFARKLRRMTGFLTAEKIYHYLRSCHDTEFTSQDADTGGLLVNDHTIDELKELFTADDHSIWYKEDVQDAGAAGNRLQTVMELPEASVISDWKKIAEQVQMEIEMYAKVRGRESSAMIQNLRAVNRERYDYSAFLRQFAVSHEDMKVSDDEFDYIYYTYGLSRYGRMPLIEPLEYRTSSKIHDFVIAIDTSGSVAGDQVQSFIQKTYNILSEHDSFASAVNIHIIQCDAALQSDTVITCSEDMDRYLSGMEIRGLGGTDFRPVFRYVDELVSQGHFSDLRGLLYFTDGLGTYPEKMPCYRTAFIFVDEGYSIPEVPPWAMKAVLRSEDIQE